MGMMLVYVVLFVVPLIMGVCLGVIWERKEAKGIRENPLRELLPDDLYDSKDWRYSNPTDRIKWLITMLANKNEEINMWVDMINHNNDLRKGGFEDVYGIGPARTLLVELEKTE